MSKLKVAKAIQKSFTIVGVALKWGGLTILVGGICLGLWAWANAHFLSFAIVIGIALTILILAGIVTAWDWSKETIREAKDEELRAQERNRVEKDREENPKRYTHSFDDEDVLYSKIIRR